MRSDSNQTLTPSKVRECTTLFDLGKGRRISHDALRTLLPEIETALFFAKAYSLDYTQLSELLRIVAPKSSAIDALLGDGTVHSTDLQDYLIDTVPPYLIELHGSPEFGADAPDTELLAQLWEQAETTVAQSIKDVAEKLGSALSTMSSVYGSMTFAHLRKLNLQRNSIGRYDAQIVHPKTPPRLVILDVSGSMTSGTVQALAAEVVGLAYKVNAHLAIVSNNTFTWAPGTATVAEVLHAAEYGGTQYETLTPLFNQDWETVITIADYDSAGAAKSYIKQHSTGRVEQVLDISLVNRPTYLAECVGQIAASVKPMLIGSSGFLLS